MSDAIKALAVCAGGAAIGLAVSGGNPLGAIGGCLAATTTVAVTGCGPVNEYEGSRLSTETDKVQPLAEKITENALSTEEEVIAITQWAQNNLFHYTDFGVDNNFGVKIYGDSIETSGGLRTVSIEEILRERAVGCHYASGVVITMLRSLGIAAEYTTQSVNGKNHGLTFIPSLNRYIHGDHVANLVCIPAEELLHSKEEERFWARHPGISAGELGYAPELGRISSGFYAFQTSMWEKYGYSLELQRTGNYLHLFGSAEGRADLEFASEICDEYHLKIGEKLGKGKTRILSDETPLQDLNDLVQELRE